MRPEERLKHAKKKTTGTKQTLKLVQNGMARVVFVAQDAESRVIDPLVKLCRDHRVEVVMVESMVELGRACGIKVGSASAAILEE